MKRYFILILLFFCTQANAITSALMVADLVAMSAFSENVSDVNHHDHSANEMHHQQVSAECSGTMALDHSEHCTPEHDMTHDCGGHCDCGFCSGHYSHAVLSSTFELSSHSRFVFESSYRFSQNPISYPMPIRPPKYS